MLKSPSFINDPVPVSRSDKHSGRRIKGKGDKVVGPSQLKKKEKKKNERLKERWRQESAAGNTRYVVGL